MPDTATDKRIIPIDINSLVSLTPEQKADRQAYIHAELERRKQDKQTEPEPELF